VAGHVVTRSIVAVILINLTAICLESVPSLAEEWQGTFLAIEIASFAISTVEYGLRLWTAVYRAPYRKLGAGRASLQFALSPGGIILKSAVEALAFFDLHAEAASTWCEAGRGAQEAAVEEGVG